MNNSFRTRILCAGFLCMSLFAVAQKQFEGTVTYTLDISGEGLPPEAKQMLAGSEMIVAMKGDKARTDMNMTMQKTTAISDAKTKTSFVLMDLMGTKYKIVSKADEKQPEVKVKELPETKEVAGYKCKKAEVTMEGQTEPITVFYTEDILNTGYNSQIKGIKGYPLQFEVNQGGMKISYTAKSVSKDKIEDSKFVIDTKDYKEVTKDELTKMMGGGK
jgi:GLPGLI family protein